MLFIHMEEIQVYTSNLYVTITWTSSVKLFITNVGNPSPNTHWNRTYTSINECQN